MLSHEAAHQVKQLRLDNDLIERVRKDAYFDPIKDLLDVLLNPKTFIRARPGTGRQIPCGVGLPGACG